jgi:hypothetical protein
LKQIQLNAKNGVNFKYASVRAFVYFSGKTLNISQKIAPGDSEHDERNLTKNGQVRYGG